MCLLTFFELGMVLHTCHHRTWKLRQEDHLEFRASLSKTQERKRGRGEREKEERKKGRK